MFGRIRRYPEEQKFGVIPHAVQTEVVSKGTFSMSLLPLARGRRDMENVAPREV